MMMQINQISTLNKNVDIKSVVVNGETFKYSTYNGFKIIIREKDGYINATKMVNEINVERQKIPGKTLKQFRVILQNKDFQDYVNELKEFLASDGIHTELIYELGQKFVDVKGTFVHPLLINYIAQWADNRYSIIVSMIMNKVNTYIQSNQQQTILDLGDQIKFLQQQIPKGYVYCFSNEEGIYKIGATDDLVRRLKEANGSYTLNPFQIIYSTEVKLENKFSIESFIHNKLKEYRITPDKEFFRCPKEIIKEQFDYIGKISQDDYISLTQQYEKQLTELRKTNQDKDQIKLLQKQISLIRSENNIQIKELSLLEFFNEKCCKCDSGFITVKQIVDRYYDYCGKKLTVKDNFHLLPDVIESYQYYDDQKNRHHDKYVIMNMGFVE